MHCILSLVFFFFFYFSLRSGREGRNTEPGPKPGEMSRILFSGLISFLFNLTFEDVLRVIIAYIDCPAIHFISISFQLRTINYYLSSANMLLLFYAFFIQRIMKSSISLCISLVQSLNVKTTKTSPSFSLRSTISFLLVLKRFVIFKFLCLKFIVKFVCLKFITIFLYFIIVIYFIVFWI